METMMTGERHLALARSKMLPPKADRKRIRKRAKLSLRELAAVMEPPVSHMAIARWEAGATPANPAHRAAYARILRDLERLLAENRGRL